MMTLFRLVLCAALAAGSNDDAPTLVVRGGRLFDPATGTSRENAQLFVRGETIVGSRDASVPVPDGVPVIDAAGCTILPGFFDLHVHVAVSGAGFTARGMVAPEENLASHLYCGVTHVVDLHGDQRTIFALRDRSRTDPSLARLYAAGAAFTAPGGHGTQFGVGANTVASDDEVKSRFDALLEKKPDVAKVIVEHGGWGGLGAMPTLSPELVAAVGARARSANLPLFAHIWSAEEAAVAVSAGARALAHGVFLGPVAPDLARAMKANGTAYVPTLAVVLASQRTVAAKPPYGRPLVSRALHPDVSGALAAIDPATLQFSPMSHPDLDGAVAFANLKALAEAGVEIGLGTDAGNPLVPHGPGALFEMQLYVDAGLSPARTLSAATIGSARILGVSDRFGSLDPGKVADVVIVRGDPLASISDVWNVEHVVKAGRPVDREEIAARNAARAKEASVRVAGKDVPATVDWFDDGDLTCDWGGAWTVTTDGAAPNGESTAKASVAEGRLRVEGEMKKGFAWGAWAGVVVQWEENRKVLVDATPFRALKMRVRGTKRPYTLTIHREAVTDFNFFTAAIPIEDEWKEIEIPFDSMKQIGFGKPVPWSAGDVVGLEIEARNPPMGGGVFGPFEFEIDWVALVK